MNLIIDIGNTRVKVAVYKENQLIFITSFRKKSLLKEIKKIKKEFLISYGIISSVSTISKEEIKDVFKGITFIELLPTTKVPFLNCYKSPKTLGADRISLVTAAVKKHPNKNVLIIDAGTCITFDIVTAKKEYLGGAISVGIKMRYQSLSHFTSKLPLLEKKVLKNLIGNTTENSIHSGVINGICNEIDGVITQYKEKFKDLTIVLTGGDTIFLSKQLKSSIFANQNFLLEGLNEILIYNT